MPLEAAFSRALQRFGAAAPRPAPAAEAEEPPATLGGEVYRALADHLPVSLIVLRIADARVVRLNAQAAAEFGLDADRVLGRSAREVLGARLAAQLAPAVERAVAERAPVEEELTLDAPARVINVRLLATFDTADRPELMVVIARDVTAERVAQRELAESRVQFQEFAAAIDEGMFVSNPQRDRFDFMSPQALACWGVTQAQIAADPGCFRRLVHPDDMARMADRAAREARLEPVDLTFRIRHPERGERWLRARTRAQRLADGELRVYGLVNDVTAEHAHENALLRARAAAEAASLAKSQFMANMSHEIRTPMNGILGMTELLLGTPLADKQRRFAKAVYRSGEALLEIINDILDFSKIEAGRLELAPADFVLRSVVEDTLELLAPRAHEKRLELNFREAPGLPAVVHADALRLRQVMTNLVANAIKFTESGEVTVDLDGQPLPDGGLTLTFSVRDTGIGIATDTLPRLFSAFTQANGGMARHYGGTGLGLAISRQLVELMGGRIEVESQLGVGSCFRFSVDVAAASADACEYDEIAELPHLRVLVVEDHQTNRIVLENLLQAWGMQVVVACDGLEALQILRGRTPLEAGFDLALVDMQMPGLDGLGFARALREERLAPQMKLILLSSVCVPDDARAAQAVGFDRFVAKPLRRTELRQAIAGVVQAQPAADGVAGTLAHCSILVVEDNGVNQEVIGQMLRHLGARVRMASSAMEGLRALTEAKFDLVLMDIQMPGMDGTEALRWFRRGSGGRFDFASPSQTPVIAVTANALGGDAQRFLDLGFDDYLSKPFRQSQLHAMLKRHLKLSPENDARAAASGDGGAPAAGLDALVESLAGVLDTQALNNLRELDPGGRGGLLPRVLRTFESSLARLLQEFNDARAAADTAVMFRVAHTLKSSTASVGAIRLSRICADIERTVRQPETPAMPALLDDMVAESNRILAAIKPVLSPLK